MKEAGCRCSSTKVSHKVEVGHFNVCVIYLDFSFFSFLNCMFWFDQSRLKLFQHPSKGWNQGGDPRGPLTLSVIAPPEGGLNASTVPPPLRILGGGGVSLMKYCNSSHNVYFTLFKSVTSIQGQFNRSAHIEWPSTTSCSTVEAALYWGGAGVWLIWNTCINTFLKWIFP